jgi:multisubunit Na+/H+ antiporter MnhG subunit
MATATADQVKARRTLVTIAAIVVGLAVTFAFPNLPGGTSHAELVLVAVIAVILAPIILRQQHRQAEQMKATRAEQFSRPPAPKTRLPVTKRYR